VIGLVAMDLSKAFDTLPHDLTVQNVETIQSRYA
jgi:hypothetical protein